MSLRSGAVIAGVIAFFFWANHLLTRPVATEEQKGQSAALAAGVNGTGSGRVSAQEGESAERKKSDQVLREMASFVAAHPEVVSSRQASALEHDRSAPSVLGTYLDQKTGAELLTREGLDSFVLGLKKFDNMEPAIRDVNQAWSQVAHDDWIQRKALLGVNRGLASVSQDPSLREAMLREFDSYHSETNPQRNPDYASQALQDFLDHEPDQKKVAEELGRRGIPVYQVPASAEAGSVK